MVTTIHLHKHSHSGYTRKKVAPTPSPAAAEGDRARHLSAVRYWHPIHWRSDHPLCNHPWMTHSISLHPFNTSITLFLSPPRQSLSRTRSVCSAKGHSSFSHRTQKLVAATLQLSSHGLPRVRGHMAPVFREAMRRLI